MKLLWVIPLLLWAQTLVAAPMTIDADRFEMHKDKKRADFFGHVEVHRDDVVIKADTMKVWYQEKQGKNELKEVQADGHVRITTATKQGEADHARFKAGSQTLLLKGNARVRSEGNVVEGEEIEYHMQTERIHVRKGKAGKQVRFIFDEASP